jgi:hypothetical protein
MESCNNNNNNNNNHHHQHNTDLHLLNVTVIFAKAALGRPRQPPGTHYRPLQGERISHVRTMFLSQAAKESLHWRVSSVTVNTFKGINSSIQVEVLVVNLVYNCLPCQYQEIQRLRF